MRFSKAVVKYRIPILAAALLLMIPSVLGMAATRINYDMLDYLPADIDTVIGQNVLMEDFGKGAFSLVIVEEMSARLGTVTRNRIRLQKSARRLPFCSRLRIPAAILPLAFGLPPLFPPFVLVLH